MTKNKDEKCIYCQSTKDVTYIDAETENRISYKIIICTTCLKNKLLKWETLK